MAKQTHGVHEPLIHISEREQCGLARRLGYCGFGPHGCFNGLQGFFIISSVGLHLQEHLKITFA